MQVPRVYDFLKKFLIKDFIYFREREREHKQGERQAEGDGEADSPLRREPNMGLDPGTLGP